MAPRLPLSPFVDDGDDDDEPPPIADQPVLEYFIIKQEVNIEVNFRDKRLDGTTDVFIAIFTDKVEEVALDAAHCEVDIDNITITELREVNGEVIEGPKRNAPAEYDDPYKKLSHPPGWNWRAEHHDLRRIRARPVFHNRKTDVPAEDRVFAGCTPVYGSLRVKLRGRGEQDRPKLILRKSTLNPDAPDTTHKQYKIRIPFSNKNPRDGVHFVGVDPLDTRFTHMYTRHSIQPGTASCIFPCIDDHGSRCDWRISVKYPRTLGDALQQALATQQNGASHGGPVQAPDGQDRATNLAEEDKLREMSVVCSGFLIEETTDPEDDHKKIMTFEPEKKVSVQKLGFAVGPFEHVDLSSECRTEEDELKLGMSALKVHAYCLPHRKDWVRNTAAALTMAADFFTYTFAKYPFGNFKICFLEDLVEDTVALHSLAFASTRLLFPEDIMDTEIEVTRKLVLTLASQWIGVNMIANTRHDTWLVVGISNFMTDLFMKRICGNNEYRFRMKTMSDRLVEVDVDRPSLYDLGPNLHLGEFEMEFMTLKASVVFFNLDKRLIKASGGHGLTRILQKLLTRVQIESTDRTTILQTEKFRSSCEKGSRYLLETFWAQWVYGSGCPRFDVKAKFNKKRLCVELTLNQVQSRVPKKAELEKDDFLRVVKERRAGVKPGEAQPLFTGPMTIRIHEADGTPYEHMLEIREDAARAPKIEIPYNTKYKRLKRTRRMKEKHNAGANADGAENADDTLLYCLGDVLQTPDDQKEWELIEWDPETERKMDQESYEWIRMDADFEWACDMKRSLEPYMYVSQLQQDRDVVAQQDAMLYLAQGPLHPIASGFLVRTLVDKRYYHGIRTMAAEALPRQSNIKDIPMLGLRQLMRAFREMFCYEQTNQPMPNDFTDKKQYKVRCAILNAIAQVRDSNTHRCPMEGRRFILDQLLYNNNEDNEYSDHFYIAMLVEALGTSLIPSQKDDWYARLNRVPTEEERQFLEEAMEQIERVLRRDEWTNSYQNIWTIAGLDAKQRLMKAEVIPKSYADFGQYLLDGTRDLIRIKCFEALIDLGAMMDRDLFTFLMYVLTTDRSPYVRNKLIQAVSRGLAAIAFGEHANVVKNEAPADDADPLLLVQDSAQEIEARQEMFARRENLDAALKALRREMDDTYGSEDRHYSTAMRKALDHEGLGRAEVESLLDLAALIFEASGSWILTVNLPKSFRVERPAQQTADRLMMKFKSYYRTRPKVPLTPPPAPAPALPSLSAATEMRPPALPRTGSIKINTSKASGSARTALPTSSVPESSTPAAVAPPKRPTNGESSQSVPAEATAPSHKRPLPDKEPSPVAKRPKMQPKTPSLENEIPRDRRLYTFKIKDSNRLGVILGVTPTLDFAPGRKALPSAAPKEPSPVAVRDGTPAKPARKPLPTGDSGRKPLPGSGPSSSPPARAPPALTVDTHAPLAASQSPAAATPTTPASASGIRKKIKLVRKPTPQQPPPET